MIINARNYRIRQTSNLAPAVSNWKRLGPEFDFMEELGYLDYVPQFAMPQLEGANGADDMPFWDDYHKIHGVPPPYHNGKGLANCGFFF